MKGDFSFLAFDTEPHYSGVLHQQGRVLLDRDWNEAAAIAATWQSAVGRDTFGPGVLAVPSSNNKAFKALSASTDGTLVKVELDAGRAWADGLSMTLDLPSTFIASYFAPPFQTPRLWATPRSRRTPRAGAPRYSGRNRCRASSVSHTSRTSGASAP